MSGETLSKVYGVPIAVAEIERAGTGPRTVVLPE